MPISIRLAVRDWDYLTPLLLKEVSHPDITIQLTRVGTLINDFNEHPEFDGGEVSLSRYSQACACGDNTLIGLPHFFMRGFRHRCIITTKNSPITSIAGLVGKRVGLTGWQDSGNIWTRAIFRQQGIEINDIHWFVGRLTEQHPIVDRLAGFGRRGVIEACPNEESMMSMLAKGTLDAVCTPFMPEGFFAASSAFRSLLPDYPKVESDYFQQHGYVPGMHILALKPERVAAHPGIGETLSALFQQAKRIWLEKRTKYADTTPWILDDIARTHRLLPENWDDQGMTANQSMLDDWCSELQAQLIIQDDLQPGHLFSQESWS